MKYWIIILFLTASSFQVIYGQEEVNLNSLPAADSMIWSKTETITDIPGEKNRMVSNVSQPSLTIFRPEPSQANGTAIIIAPGGGFHFLSIDNEGFHFAQWCAEQGITAFVLKYRLVPTQGNPFVEFLQKVRDRDRMDREVRPYIDLAKNDALAAIAYVRSHAKTYEIDPDRIGIAGFSAGGTLAGHAAFHHDHQSRPDFSVPVYAALHAVDTDKIPEKPMPLFIAVTSDDIFGFEDQSVDLYRQWNSAGQAAELHVYERGGHGFGMKNQGQPSDNWIDDLAGWMRLHGWL